MYKMRNTKFKKGTGIVQAVLYVLDFVFHFIL
jgi:hypothetical protein